MITEKMSLKSFNLFALSVFALVFVMGIGSAVTFNAEISAANPTIVSSSFTPQLDSTLLQNTEAFIGRTTNRIGTSLGTPGDTIFWKIIIDGPSTLTADMVDLDEVGYLDPPDTVSHIETFHYPFAPDGSGNLVVVGSCDGNVIAVGHSNSCTHNTGFSLDANDVFNNTDKIKFNSNAPVGTYTITYQLVNTDGAGSIISNSGDTHQVTFTLTSPTTSVPSDIQTCTGTGMPSDMDVRAKKIDFTNNGMQYASFGDDNSWFPFEDIEADIEVKNYGDFDADNVEVFWGLYDTDSNEWVIELDSEKDFRLKHGDSETLTVTFSVNDDVDMDLSDITDGNHYKFYVYAEGVVDDSDSLNDGKDFCASSSEDVDVVIESDFVVLNNFQVPETVQCGETVQVTADVWNIGDRDQDSVSVDVYDKDRVLIDKIFDVGDIDTLDNADLSFSFQVPNDAEEKTYSLTFRVLDENEDVYQDEFDDDESVFPVPLQVSGNCGAAGAGEVSVVANIASGGGEGQKLVVRATVTNTGNSQKTYALNVAGFEDLASSFSLDKNSLTLGAGESGDVSVTLDVNDDAAGSRTFFLELVSGGELVRQPVNVSITERGAGITGLVTGENWYLWGIGLLNIILVVVIIVVAVRIARK